MIERILPAAREHALFDGHAIAAMEAAPVDPTGPSLMQRAGLAVARLAMAVAPHAERIGIWAGPGNNGGDAFEAAAVLHQAGRTVDVAYLAGPGAQPADARAALERARQAGVRIVDGPGPPRSPPIDLAIDGLLGGGLSRPVTGALAGAIRSLQSGRSPVLSIDLPSGLDGDTGHATGEATVSASHTIALLGLRPGHFTADGRDRAGTLWLDRLGVDDRAQPRTAVLARAPAPGDSPRRRHAQHKGSFGDVIVVGGAAGLRGAAVLAARAAVTAGAGRVHVELLDAAASSDRFDATRPELMFGAPAHRSGTRSTVVCGCGGGADVRRVLPQWLARAERLVLDADALNAIAADSALAALLAARAGRGRATILTPHPLEAARLLQSTTAAVQADRLGAARELAIRHRCIVVLKGSGTITAAPGSVPTINGTGSAALASAGTGDVLAGWIGGRWAQQAQAADEPALAFTMAVRSVGEHGAAGDRSGSAHLPAADLIDALGRW